MLNLPEIDRELDALCAGRGPTDVNALLDGILGKERSMARLDELLSSIGSGVTIERRVPSSRPPLAATFAASAPSLLSAALTHQAPAEARRIPPSNPPPAAVPNHPLVRSSLPPRIVSPLSPVVQGARAVTPWPPLSSSSSVPPKRRDTLVDAPFTGPPPLAPSEIELDAETRALFGITDPPGANAETVSETAVTTVNPEPPRTPSPLPVAPELSRSLRPMRQTLKMHGSNAPPNEAALLAQNEASAPSSGSVLPDPGRDRMRELLDRDLDPRDFPSSYPPAAPATISVAPKTPPPLPSKRDSFEMVIEDDEEIIEIEDVELEEIE